jgi:hypothetical protein
MRPGCVILLAAAQMWGAGLRAGVARKEITPREAIWMSGYASRNHASVAVRQQLRQLRAPRLGTPKLLQLALQLRDWFWNGCAFTLHYQPHLGD